MAKKSPVRKAKKTAGTKKRKFSMRRIHNAFDISLDRLKKEKKTRQRDALIGLVERLQQAAECPQNMLIDLE